MSCIGLSSVSKIFTTLIADLTLITELLVTFEVRINTI